MKKNVRRVLIVDDDPLYLRLVVSIIEQMGIAADAVESGEDALPMLGHYDYSMMITDLNLPGMDGLKLSQKARERCLGLHIVMITGDSSLELEMAAAQAGVAELHTKPCTAKQFRNIVGLVAPHFGAEHGLPSTFP